MRYRMKWIGIHVLAFFVARCRAFGMYPFVVPFFMAAYIEERSSVSLFVVLMLGLISRLELVPAIRYGMALIFLLAVLSNTDREKIFSDNNQIALASGIVLMAISMPYQYVVTGMDNSLLFSVLEGVIASCFTLIFEQGIVGFKVGADRRFSDNKRFIGIFVCLAVGLFGLPLVYAPVNLLFLICSFLLLYYSYRFEGSIAIAAGSVTGLVLSFQLKEVSYLAVMILLAGIMILLRELGKAGIIISYTAGIILLGILYEDKLLSTGILGAVLMASAAFIFTPRALIKRSYMVKRDEAGLSQNLLIQEATKERIEKFGQAFFAMEYLLFQNEQERKNSLPTGLSNMYLSGDGISLLNAVESQSNRLSDMRMNFIKQLGRLGGIITSFQSELSEQTVRADYFEGRAVESLGKKGIDVSKAVLLKGKDGRHEVYISCKTRSKSVMTGDGMAAVLSKALRKPLVCVGKSENIVSRNEELFTFVEKGRYMLTTGIVRKSRTGERLSGDNFSVTKLDAQKAVLMISDGMGFGESAYVKSGQIVELLEQLLSAGFCMDLTIELINSVISFLSGGSVSSTLDLLMIDFYTGDADFVKLGASATFIKREGKVECIRSASLPVGILEQIEFDTCERKLYHGDIIVMVSDGILDGIVYDDKEAYLAELIAGTDTNNVQQLAQKILDEVEEMHQGIMRDDSTVLVAGMWER